MYLNGFFSNKERRSLTGTARYASINAHGSGDQSRRDDMESAGYLITYLARGSLPWQGIKAANKRIRYERICEKKQGRDFTILSSAFWVLVSWVS
jgi:hypothetical protein